MKKFLQVVGGIALTALVVSVFRNRDRVKDTFEHAKRAGQDFCTKAKESWNATASEPAAPAEDGGNN